MHRLGFSTGALAKGDFRRALRWLSDASVDAVELSALRAAELPDLVGAIGGLDLARFGYKSIHAPTDAEDEAAIIDKLKPLADMGYSIVIHPDRVRSFSAWRSLNGALCIENMDARKPTGRTVAELERCFEQIPDAGFCFDIGHARQVDPTMSEAVAMIERFGDRLRQVHLSEVDSAGGHHPLTWGGIEAFRSVLARIPESVPVILESTVKESDIQDEINEARSLLSKPLTTR